MIIHVVFISPLLLAVGIVVAVPNVFVALLLLLRGSGRARCQGREMSVIRWRIENYKNGTII
jgi:hypothetical protein